MKIIEIVVSPHGETRVETKGFTGSECQQASRFVELAIGKVIEQRLTDEFHRLEATKKNKAQLF